MPFSPQIPWYLHSALDLALGVYFIAYGENLSERNISKLFGRLFIVSDRANM